MLAASVALLAVSLPPITRKDWVDDLGRYVVMDKRLTEDFHIGNPGERLHQVIPISSRYVALRGLDQASAMKRLEKIFPPKEGWVWKSKWAPKSKYGTLGIATRGDFEQIDAEVFRNDNAWIYKAEGVGGTFFIKKVCPVDPVEAGRALRIYQRGKPQRR